MLILSPSYYRRVVWPGCCLSPTKSHSLCESRPKNKLWMIRAGWLFDWYTVTVWLNGLYCCFHSWRSRLNHCAAVYFWYQRITNSCSVRYTYTHNIQKQSKSCKNKQTITGLLDVFVIPQVVGDTVLKAEISFPVSYTTQPFFPSDITTCAPAAAPYSAWPCLSVWGPADVWPPWSGCGEEEEHLPARRHSSKNTEMFLNSIVVFCSLTVSSRFGCVWCSCSLHLCPFPFFSGLIL